jgi:hypothetical protein
MKNLSTGLVYEDFIGENIYPGFLVPGMTEPEITESGYIEPWKFGRARYMPTYDEHFFYFAEWNILMLRKQQVLGYTTVGGTCT